MYNRPWQEELGNVMNLGLPIFLLIIAISSFVWFTIEVKRKKIELKNMIGWLTTNIIFTLFVIYILIVSILHLFNIDNIPNIFNMIAYYMFGIKMDNAKQWIILLILGFIAYILLKSLKNSIEIAKLNKRVDMLGNEVSILKGKINKTTKFNIKVPKVEKSVKVIKDELKEKRKIAKTLQRHNKKINDINNK
ncbi:hypothetical protein [Candidatus Mycoplasma mahonii]|uniref:hypothetical protein n=1 Tax=Candidatus Mycoplasma mahonii TaxID=3004105 RepID=UPI0026ECC03B|nr:hypothetical protein [Candidatus Mycoplasma mahonii]WKX02522.1 hypothetical protein O3I44_00370 [Candidatus Mycoplasma mahonii]